MSETLHLLAGPTASGKSSAAVVLAQLMNAEIVAVDSMTIYRGMDIGTAKPSGEIRALVPHHLVDIVDPSDTFSVAQFVALARRTIAEIHSRGRAPLLVGGTPMYMRAFLSGLFEGPAADWNLREELHRLAEKGEEGGRELHARLALVDPESARRLHPRDVRRVVRALEVHAKSGQPISALQRQWKTGAPPFDKLMAPSPANGGIEGPAERMRVLALRRRPEDLRQRINQRVDEMFARGLVAEVKELLQRPGGWSRTARAAVGYSEVLLYVDGVISLEDAVERVRKRTWRVARKQLTWLRHFPGVEWVDAAPETTPENVGKALYKHIESWHNHAPVMG